MALKFTKVKKDETAENQNPKSVTPPPSTDSTEKREGVPGLGSKIVGAKVESGEKKPRGIPSDVKPMLSTKVGGSGAEAPEKKTSPSPASYKVDSSGVVDFDPKDSEPVKRKPGRPPGGSSSGGGRGKSKKQEVLSVDKMAQQIHGWHMMGDVIVPGLGITQGEARMMAEGIKGVMDAYDFEPDPRIMSLVVLVGTVGAVEFPKVKVLQNHFAQAKKREQVIKQARAAQQQQTRPAIVQGEPVPAPTNNQGVAVDNNPSGIFGHLSNGVAKGNPGE